MNPSKVIPFFIGFLGFFLASLSVRFYYTIPLRIGEGGVPVWMWGLLVMGALFLSQVFSFLGVRSKWVALGAALGFTFVSFGVVTTLESNLSQKKLTDGASMENFNDLRDHCGVYAGRAVIRIFDALLMSPDYAALREYQIGCSCRLHHFRLLEKNQAVGCKGDETQIQCRVRWMGAFAANGYWNLEARDYFFQNIMKLWEETHQDESLVSYVLKDQELQISALNDFQQAGLGEVLMRSRAREMKDLEEAHRRLSRKIFETVADAIQDRSPREHPEPFRFKFHDAYVDFLSKNKN